MLIHPSSGAGDLFVELFHGLYCSGSMCVGVTLWFGWGGVVSGYRLKPASGIHKSGRHRKRWKEEVERGLQVLAVRRWRELVADKKKWKDIVRQAKVHSGL